MRSSIDNIVAIIRGFRDGADVLERHRIDRIRNSDILIDGPRLQGAFDSAKYLGIVKPMTGLVELRELLTRMGR